jgi:hypothetical protein
MQMRSGPPCDEAPAAYNEATGWPALSLQARWRRSELASRPGAERYGVELRDPEPDEGSALELRMPRQEGKRRSLCGFFY